VLPWVLAANPGSEPILIFTHPVFQKRFLAISPQRAYASATHHAPAPACTGTPPASVY